MALFRRFSPSCRLSISPLYPLTSFSWFEVPSEKFWIRNGRHRLKRASGKVAPVTASSWHLIRPSLFVWKSSKQCVKHKGPPSDSCPTFIAGVNLTTSKAPGWGGLHRPQNSSFALIYVSKVSAGRPKAGSVEESLPKRMLCRKKSKGTPPIGGYLSSCRVFCLATCAS